MIRSFFVALIMLTISVSQLSSQITTYECFSQLSVKRSYETKSIANKVVFSKSDITVTDYLNGGTEDLVVKIDSTAKKKYAYDGMCNWYYCSSVKEDPMLGHTRYIIIVEDSSSPEEINIFHFVSEVNVYETTLLVK